MKVKIILILIAASLIFVTSSVKPLKGGAYGRAHIPNDEYPIYVTSSRMYYDTFVTADPLQYNEHNGNSFQELYFVDGQATTDFGPGDPGYHGGRRWRDKNGNDKMDPKDDPSTMEIDGDHYFLCPLLPPGYEID